LTVGTVKIPILLTVTLFVIRRFLDWVTVGFSNEERNS
jgi:hypothetical protein